MIETTLMLRDEFHETALAFPGMVREWIAKIEHPALAADAMAKSAALADYARRIQATTEEVNAVQYGKLLLAAKVGELCPAEKGGRGKVRKNPAGFSRDTLGRYRTLAKHQEMGLIDAYANFIEAGGNVEEMSISGFLRYVLAADVKSESPKLDKGSLRQPQRPTTGIGAVIGSMPDLPAENPDADLEAAADAYEDDEDDDLPTRPDDPVMDRLVADMKDYVQKQPPEREMIMRARVGSLTDLFWPPEGRVNSD